MTDCLGLIWTGADIDNDGGTQIVDLTDGTLERNNTNPGDDQVDADSAAGTQTVTFPDGAVINN